MEKFIYIGCTLALTVYGQLIIKARSVGHTETEGPGDKLSYISAMFTDIGVLSGLAAAALAGVFWMLTIEKTRLSFAYPFMALSFVFVPVAGSILFNEPLSPVRLLSLALIVGGVAINALA